MSFTPYIKKWHFLFRNLAQIYQTYLYATIIITCDFKDGAFLVISGGLISTLIITKYYIELIDVSYESLIDTGIPSENSKIIVSMALSLLSLCASIRLKGTFKKGGKIVIIVNTHYRLIGPVELTVMKAKQISYKIELYYRFLLLYTKDAQCLNLVDQL